MSKMSDMAQTIEELRSAAAAITDAANWLAQQFSDAGSTDPVPEAQPEKKPDTGSVILDGKDITRLPEQTGWPSSFVTQRKPRSRRPSRRRNRS